MSQQEIFDIENTKEKEIYFLLLSSSLLKETCQLMLRDFLLCYSPFEFRKTEM